MSEIKLPPLPAGYGLSISAAMREYARAAVALNAPKWRKTANELPPTTYDRYVCMRDSGVVEIQFGDFIQHHAINFPFWMPLPPLPAEPEAT